MSVVLCLCFILECERLAGNGLTAISHYMSSIFYNNYIKPRKMFEICIDPVERYKEQGLESPQAQLAVALQLGHMEAGTDLRQNLSSCSPNDSKVFRCFSNSAGE